MQSGNRLEKREDDTEETIQTRMKVCHEETEPVRFWSERERLHTIVPYNGVKDIDEIVNGAKK
eukprot:CCRYP_008126-RA/>CCRYP_008126-RA protein AED:0.39 eAED:0.39 QI:0/-1/0/1/-1/1/1/0/62